jgi:hypothetical protein
MLGENPLLKLRADLGPSRDRFFNAQVGASRTPHGEERASRTMGGWPILRDAWPAAALLRSEADRRTHPCKSPVDRLYYQAIGLLWDRNGPVFAALFGHRPPDHHPIYRHGAPDRRAAGHVAIAFAVWLAKSRPEGGSRAAHEKLCKPRPLSVPLTIGGMFRFSPHIRQSMLLERVPAGTVGIDIPP